MTTHNLPYTLPHDTAGDVPQLVARALQEDIGHGDITAMLIPADKEASASVISRDSAVICGRPWVDEVFRQLDPNTRVDWEISEGDVVSPDQTLFTLTGNARVLLTGERTALNFLQTLSATATLARQYADLSAVTVTSASSTHGKPFPACDWHRNMRSQWAVATTIAWAFTMLF